MAFTNDEHIGKRFSTTILHGCHVMNIMDCVCVCGGNSKQILKLNASLTRMPNCLPQRKTKIMPLAVNELLANRLEFNYNHLFSYRFICHSIGILFTQAFHIINSQSLFVRKCQAAEMRILLFPEIHWAY